LFVYGLGAHAYDGAYANLMDNGTAGSYNWHTDMRDRWMEPGDVTNIPRLSSQYDTNVGSSSTRYITKADYFGFNNFVVGYSLPQKWVEKMGVQNFNLNVSGDNLMMLSARDGFNPSTSESGATSTYTYSPLSTFTFGAKVKF